MTTLQLTWTQTGCKSPLMLRSISYLRWDCSVGGICACKSCVEAYHIGIQIAIVIRGPQEGVDCPGEAAHAST